MKKDLWVKLAGLAIVLTLISTTLVSGTYANYVKTATGTDSARVAKFAFSMKDQDNNTVTQSVASAAFDLFSMTADTGVYNDGVNGAEKFIAPGTTGSFTLSLANLSEVVVEASFGLVETNDGVGGVKIPIYYFIDGSTQRYSDVLTGGYEGAGTYQGLTALADAMEAAMGADNNRLSASDGTVPATAEDIVVHWAWAFDSAGGQQSDENDTALGIDGEVEVELAVTVTVEQVNVNP